MPTFDDPHTVVFFVLSMLCLAVAVAPLPSRFDLRSQRYAYWSGVGGASVFAFLAALPDWTSAIVLFLTVWVVMVIPAYFSSPYIKVGGKVVAFHIDDSQAESPQRGADATPRTGAEVDSEPDSYAGRVTAAKMWWLLIFAVGICSFNVGVHFIDEDTDKPWLWIVTAVALVLIALAFGHGDASWGYAVARGQYVQFGIITLISAGVFAVVYLVAYRAGRRWPLRPKRSMEYRAHPRFHEDER